MTENGDIIKNKYDPLGLRYQKEINGEVHKYIFDGWSIVAETDKEGELKSREVRGYELLKKETNNKQYYYHQNEHGDIIYLSNVDEEIENSYLYDVFGNVREQQENVENIFKYTGEQFDKETQQYYLRARFYNPVIGRFTQEDVYRGDGLNLYVYVVNNPLLWVDPSGHAKCTQGEETIQDTSKVKTRVETYTDSSGVKVKREYIKESQALDLLDELAGGPQKFDSDFYEIKPDWYINKEGTVKIEFNLTGHENPPEPPHIKLQLKTKTTKKGPNSGWDTKRKIFIEE